MSELVGKQPATHKTMISEAANGLAHPPSLAVPPTALSASSAALRRSIRTIGL